MIAMKNLWIIFIMSQLQELLCKRVSEQRSLIFPPTAPTRAQLIYGIGIPLELETESMTTGYVLKAEYFLPTKAEELRPTMLHPQPINKRNARGYNNTQTAQRSRPTFQHQRQYKSNEKLLAKYRWAVYKGIEVVADRIGLDGRACMLRSICETAEIPFVYHSGILGELMQIIMTPSSSVDDVQQPSDYAYYHAEVLGKSGAPCDRAFKECRFSIIEYFSNIFHFEINSKTRE